LSNNQPLPRFPFKVSAASSEIEATVGEHYPMIDASGNVTLDAKGRPILNYSLTHAIFMGCVFTGIISTRKPNSKLYAYVCVRPPITRLDPYS
jgi:hypothetical protein